MSVDTIICPECLGKRTVTFKAIEWGTGKHLPPKKITVPCPRCGGLGVVWNPKCQRSLSIPRLRL